MKLCGMLSVLALVMSGITSYSQDLEAEVPGDNFSLEGALELFKKSESPEHFEKLLNSPDSKVNNLDLNGDGYIDYIRVFDRYKGNVHAFILQAVVTENESQDIAVIELEKLSNGKAVLQIIGDEDIYGIETIIEPTSQVRTYAGARTSTTVVNVWGWPSVQYIYGPYYSAWYSPWTWHAYPVWWRSWRPIAYVHYHPIYVRYRPYYSYCYERRIVHAHHIYRPYRTTSVVVSHRHRDQINHYRSNNRDGYRDGYARNDRGRNYSSGRSSNNASVDQPRRSHENVNRSFSQGRSGVKESGRTENSRITENSRNSDNVNRVQRQQDRVISNGKTMRQQESREVEAPKVNSREREQKAPVTRNAPSTQRTSDFRQSSERRSREVATPPTRNYEAPRRSQSTPREQTRSMNSSPSRSTNVQRNVESRQMSRPSVERKSPAASPRQQTPGGSRNPDRRR